MSSGRFSAFQDDASDSSSSASGAGHDPNTKGASDVLVPSFEDLSSYRHDEETVLEAVYGNDFSKKDGAWGCPELLVSVRPPDIDDPSHIGSELQLSVQLTKQYPYVVPKITFKEVKGLSKMQQTTLMTTLQDRAKELASSGSVMVCELVQLTEDYLLEHNQDPTLSAWEQMKQRQEKEEKQNQLLEAQRAKELKLLTRNDVAENSDHHDQFRTTTSLTFSSASSPISSSHGGSSMRGVGEGIVSNEVERELSRQMHALAAAAEQRRKLQQQHQARTNAGMEVGGGGGGGGGPAAGMDSPSRGISGGGDDNNNNNDAEFDDDEDDDDESDFDPDNDYNNNLNVSSSYSRYKADFVELGILGRGGGGEVVKVRNRLDRRICKLRRMRRGNFLQCPPSHVCAF